MESIISVYFCNQESLKSEPKFEKALFYMDFPLQNNFDAFFLKKKKDYKWICSSITSQLAWSKETDLVELLLI